MITHIRSLFRLTNFLMALLPSIILYLILIPTETNVAIGKSTYKFNRWTLSAFNVHVIMQFTDLRHARIINKNYIYT